MSRLTNHDKSVLRRAVGLENNGWKVSADIPGFPKPPKLCVPDGCARPDIFAEKGKRRRIVEVETPESWNRNESKEQRRLLRAWAEKKSRTEVQVRTAY